MVGISVEQTIENMKLWSVSDRLQAVNALKDSIEEEYAVLKSNENVFHKDDEPAPRKKNEIVNPWRLETFNLTKQAEIYREDPELAEKLKAEAV